MPRSTLIGASIALAALSVAAPALAQDRPPLRQLQWAGRPATDPARDARRGAPVIPHAGDTTARVALRPAQPWRPTAGRVDGRPGLTPASAFAEPRTEVAQTWSPPSAPAPAPVVETAPVRTAPAPERRHAPQPQPQPERRPEPQPVLEAQPQAQGRMVSPSPYAAPTPTPQPEPQPAPVSATDDPMAPRRDAPIFRIQGAQSGAAPAPQAAAPAQQGARYYSVHRQAGHAPDPTALPAPVWLDRMPVELDSTPQSEDLAAPPETPQMVRGSDGRLRPVQSAQGDSTP